MSTSAIISMVIIQGTITIITLRIYYMVMHPPKKGKEKEENKNK